MNKNLKANSWYQKVKKSKLFIKSNIYHHEGEIYYNGKKTKYRKLILYLNIEAIVEVVYSQLKNTVLPITIGTNLRLFFFDKIFLFR